MLVLDIFRKLIVKLFSCQVCLIGIFSIDLSLTFTFFCFLLFFLSEKKRNKTTNCAKNRNNKRKGINHNKNLLGLVSITLKRKINAENQGYLLQKRHGDNENKCHDTSFRDRFRINNHAENHIHKVQ
nr:MAG TPA: hypothetical protein [Caudoviricetes sp.]